MILDKADYDNHKAIEESTSYIMNQLLRTVMSMGTGTPYNVEGQTTFGKTGTTDEDKDRWFVGGTPYYVAAVWYGYDTPREIYNVWNNPAGNLFKEVMDRVHYGKDYMEFPSEPSGVTEAYYCTNSGMLASSGCPTDLGYFKSDDMPAYCSGHYSSGGGGGDSEGSSSDGGDSGTSDGGGTDSSAETPSENQPDTGAENEG